MHAVPDPLLVAQALEALMLLCFGLAWPINSIQMLRSERPLGKGLCFTLIVLAGYVAGASAKLVYASAHHADLQPVFWLYLLNSATVATNALLYRRYCRNDPTGSPERSGRNESRSKSAAKLYTTTGSGSNRMPKRP